MVNVCDIDRRVYSVVLCFVATVLTSRGRPTPGEHAMLPIGGRPSLGVCVRTRIWRLPGLDPASARLITLDLGARAGRCHSPRNPAVSVHGSSAHPRGSKSSVTPAQAGVQVRLVDSRLRGNDCYPRFSPLPWWVPVNRRNQNLTNEAVRLLKTKEVVFEKAPKAVRFMKTHELYLSSR